jgi:hypothetical protein
MKSYAWAVSPVPYTLPGAVPTAVCSEMGQRLAWGVAPPRIYLFTHPVPLEATAGRGQIKAVSRALSKL